MKINFSKTLGKVRNIYDLGQTLLLESTDRLSAFDRYVCDVPGKGVALNQLAAWWFKKTANIIPNHVLAVLHPRAMQVKKCRVFPIEVVVRGYITGSTDTSLWTLYQRGERKIFGHSLPEGLKKNSKLPHPILTPTSKHDEHDQPLQRADLVNIPNLTPIMWKIIEHAALQLFDFANQLLSEKGLLIADTKYEFGLDEQDNLCLVDELFTSDSSRYWEIEDWQNALREAREPYAYDKEILRLWYKQQCDPYQIPILPAAPAGLIATVGARYRTLYEKITHQRLPTEDITCAELLDSLATNQSP